MNYYFKCGCKLIKTSNDFLDGNKCNACNHIYEQITQEEYEKFRKMVFRVKDSKTKGSP